MRSCLLFALIFAASAFAQVQPRQPQSRRVQPRPPAKSQSRFQSAANHYAVYLEDTPVAARFASREQMQAPEATAYRQQIEARQLALRAELASRNILVTGSVSTLLNAVFVSAPPERRAEIQGIPGVVAVQPMRRGKMLLNQATQLMNAPVAWTKLGGPQLAGAGMKIAILDTGIDQTHPAFQDSSLAMPKGFPICTKGHPEDCAYTNNKVIVARSYVRMIGAGTGPADSSPDDFSPRDRQGHGTAVASAAAAAQNTETVTFTGMAPKAYLGNYKVYGSSGLNDFPPEDVWIAALEDALNDGMDVANFSSGVPAFTGALDTGAVCGLPTGMPCDPIASAFETAARAGLMIAVAAGNDGSDGYLVYPLYTSVSSPATAPSVIAAGATINSHVLQPSVSVTGANVPKSLTSIPGQMGDSFFFPSEVGANQAPLVDVTTLGDNGFACSSLPTNSLTGVFALIQTNASSTPCDLFTQSQNAYYAGATGIVFYMATAVTPVNPEDLYLLGPSLAIANSDGLALKSFIDANPGRTVVIDAAGAEQTLASYSLQYNFSPPLLANQLASYSSFGPAPDGSIKPDLVATGGFDPFQMPDPGDSFLPAPGGMYLAGQSYDPNGILYSVNGYAAADGTSFASPLVAGAAALMKQIHPGFTGAQLKSALVNSAGSSVTIDDLLNPVDVVATGAGLLDAGAASNATVTAEPSSLSFGFLQAAGLPATKTVTVTNKGTSPLNLAVAITHNTTSASVSLTPTPSSLSLAAGAAATLTLTLTGGLPAAGEYSGFVTLQASGVLVRIPYMFLVGNGVPYNFSILAGGGGGAPGADVGPIVVHIIDQYGVPVTGTAVSYSVSPRRSATIQSVPGAPACSPTTSTATAVCNTDSYGNSYVEVIVGTSATTQPTVTATVIGNQIPISYAIVTPPAITAAGVVDVTSSTTPVAPGSYISIYGSNLVDPNALFNLNGDTATPLPDGALPLTLDGTTVSFDVPSAGLSVPGYMYFVSPGQIDLWVPRELQNQTSAQVKVTVDEGIFGNVVTVPLANYAPSFFQYGSGIVVAQDQNYQLISTTNPVARGQVAVLYANGLGPVTNPPASGDVALASPLSTTTTTPQVTIGGQAANVVFSGLTPGTAGLYQIDVTIPAGLTAGTQSIALSIGGQASKTLSISVK